MNKKASSIAITVLVLMALILAGAALLSFNMNMNKVSAKIIDSRFLDDIYVKEEKFDFYINQIIEKAILRINNKENPVPEFINNFKEELLKYKQNSSFIVPELQQVENQINEDNIEFNGKEIVINLNIKIDKTFNEKLIVSHAYAKEYKNTINLKYLFYC